MFQVVPPCGGHPSAGLVAENGMVFQVVPPCGGHLSLGRCSPRSRSVSSRAPVWGASLPQAGWNWRHLRFKSCPRVGGIPGGFRILRLDIQFQVVPPCGGHQRWELYRKAAAEVSSRAPVWGASSWARRQRIVDSFQVVPPCGGHREKFQSSLFAQFVSSRAPVWGASKIMAAALAPCQFQVVPPCGGHLLLHRLVDCCHKFQVVPPCGGHLQSIWVSRGADLFQVVPPCGGHRASGRALG